EEIHEQEGEHDAEKSDVERSRYVQLEQGRRRVGGHRDDALELADAREHRDSRDGEDADDDGARDPPVTQAGYEEKPKGSEDRLYGRDVPECEERCRIVDDEAGVSQPDDPQEQTDSCRYGKLQRVRDAVDDPLSDRQHAQYDEDQAGEEH